MRIPDGGSSRTLEASQYANYMSRAGKDLRMPDDSRENFWNSAFEIRKTWSLVLRLLLFIPLDFQAMLSIPSNVTDSDSGIAGLSRLGYGLQRRMSRNR